MSLGGEFLTDTDQVHVSVLVLPSASKHLGAAECLVNERMLPSLHCDPFISSVPILHPQERPQLLDEAGTSGQRRVERLPGTGNRAQKSP